MFSRLRIRTKILTILVPPILGLTAFAGIAAGDRLDDRSQAESAVAVSDLSDALRNMLYRVQAERLHTTVALAAGDPIDSQELADLRLATDGAAQTLARAAGALGSGSVAESDPVVRDAASQAADAPARVAALRGTVTADSDARTVFDAYSELNAAMIAVNGVIAGRSEVPGHATQALHWAEAGVEAEARAATAAAIGLTDPTVTTWANETFAAEAATARNAFATYAVDASDIGRSTLEAVLASAEVGESNGWFAAGATDALSTMPSDPDRWTALVDTRLAAYTGSEAELLAADREVAVRAADDADRKAKLFAGVAGAVLLTALTLAAMAARAIIVNLRALTDAARHITDEQLPAMVRSLRSADEGAALRFDPVVLDTGDEFSDVAAALNALGATAVDVAEEQRSTLRRGISDIFVNLARRNQSLLDRQIEFIDVLEANEQDPDQLENLFRLDHLATRMRRNAESLLVLAGSEPPRRRVQDVTMNDVIRVAIGEVEDYARINITTVDEATTLSTAAVDIAHLLSELMENGTDYSPPDTSVDISGTRTDDGYVITVVDKGVGMTAEQVAAANELMARPVAVGLNMSRSLGFTVVSTLAARHGLAVSLASTPNEGVAVHVLVPAPLLDGGAPATPVPVAAAQESVETESPQTESPQTESEHLDIAVADAEGPDPLDVAPSTDDDPSAATLAELPIRDRQAEQDPEPLMWNPVLGDAAPTDDAHPVTSEFSENGSGVGAPEWGSAAMEWTEAVPSWDQVDAHDVGPAEDLGLPEPVRLDGSSPFDDPEPHDTPVADTSEVEEPVEETAPEPLIWEPVAEVAEPVEETAPEPLIWEPVAEVEEAVEETAPEPLTWEPAPEYTTASSAAPTLADSLATGEDFDEDLAALLDDGDAFPPAPTPPTELTADGLPLRPTGHRPATFDPADSIGRVSSPLRPPEAVRQTLSDYRAGRKSGRLAETTPTESVDDEQA